mmetsp:Transcript_101599/g.206382  ORF Transcript_101599/g.206382 Transcript_101599/m.206382 type:complete len:456 (-) Transcript_101599:117-1484(-)
MTTRHIQPMRRITLFAFSVMCASYLVHSVGGFAFSLSRTESLIQRTRAAEDTTLSAENEAIEKEPPTTTNVLVVGGSGRVGGSTVRWLEKYSSRDPTIDLKIKVGGRSKNSFDVAKRNGVIPTSTVTDYNIDFVPLDWAEWSDEKIEAAILGCDCGLVVHTAGPFQGRTDPTLLRCCVKHKIPYVDVCDEFELAATAKELFDESAKDADVAAVVASGIWPGMSALMAANAVEKLEEKNPGQKADTIDFSFFTAGTGNAGPTIVSATFLLLATPVLTFRNGRKTEIEPWTDPRDVEFGSAVGTKPIWLLDNPDVPTTALSLGVPNVSSRFGTDPLPWNYLFGAMKAIPRNILYDRNLMQKFALFSEPIIRFVDMLVGATNAMRVDVTSKDGKARVTSQIVHNDLEVCVGLATAAFAIEVLKKDTIPAGVWYPAELPKEARSNLLKAAEEETITYVV